ncbi:hypothetical protein NDU88_000776 [Pleurodeles waltl]|uniref:Uncharacterized protein n=1 Tax=Pleurodeles waltl TaxID=8319 RepID=A0AAV7L9M7_PLEWA|nr:hypothetical protein NDU88_000776 [Pleurodeles waltl]
MPWAWGQGKQILRLRKGSGTTPHIGSAPPQGPPGPGGGGHNLDRTHGLQGQDPKLQPGNMSLSLSPYFLPAAPAPDPGARVPPGLGGDAPEAGVCSCLGRAPCSALQPGGMLHSALSMRSATTNVRGRSSDFLLLEAKERALQAL